jgi:hypothetical protein
MNHDPSSLDAALQGLRATPLEAALLQRLEAAADGTLTQLSPAEVRFEDTLQQFAPTALDPDFMARLLATTHDVPFPMDEKILPFPQIHQPAAGRQKSPQWAAAAAVALIGGLAALMLPGREGQELSSQPRKDLASTVTPQGWSKNLVPTAFDRGVSELSHEGVFLNSENHPLNVIKIVYKDLVTLKDEQGRSIQVEQPRVEYLSAPAKLD